MGHGGEDGLRTATSLAGPAGGYDFGDGVAVPRATGGNGCRDRVSCRGGMGHADVGPVGLGGGGMGANVSDIHADVEVVQAEALVGTIAAYSGPSVHADDLGLGAEVLDEEGRGVEGADILTQEPVRPGLGGGGPIRRGGRRPQWSVILRLCPRWSGLSAGRQRVREVPPPLWGRP